MSNPLVENRHAAKRGSLAVAAIGALLLLGCGSVLPAAEMPPPIKAGQPAPEFTLKDTAGRAWTLSKLRGKAVLMDFGRVTCIPCQGVLGELQRLHEQYGKRGLQVLAVNLDGPMADRVPKFRKEKGLTYPFPIDRDMAVAERYGVETIPFLVLVDSKGKVRMTHLGYGPDFRGTMDAAVRAALPPAR